MAFYDEQLQALQGKILQKTHLESKYTTLQFQRQAMQAKVDDLEVADAKEQADVTELETMSFANLFHTLRGTKEKQLDKERAEAYASHMKLTIAQGELMAMDGDLVQLQKDIDGLADAPQAYQALLDEKIQAAQQSGLPQAKEIFAIEERIAALRSQCKELQEAIDAGGLAQNTARAIITALQKAHDYGVWDTMGGGLVAGMAKYDAVDSAQKMAATLQRQLAAFKTELADVQLEDTLHVSMGTGLQFADFFFDGLVADLMVLDKINNSTDQAETVKNSVSAILRKLKTMVTRCEETLREEKEELEALMNAITK